MPSMASDRARPPAGSRSATATLAPSAANRSHMARPMPLAPPVTTATLPTSRWAYGMLSVIALLLLGLFGLFGAPDRVSLGTDEDVLHVAEGIEGIGPELP